MEPVTIDEDGRVHGFYALEGQCHLGYLNQGICVPATLDTVFASFHEKLVTLDDGNMIRVGFATASDDHVSAELDGADVLAVQSDISVLAAVLTAYYYEGAGIYLAGHLLDDVDPGLVNRMRLGYPSGHWSVDAGKHHLELFHWVTKPGFAPKWYVEPPAVAASAATLLNKSIGETMSTHVATRRRSRRDLVPVRPATAAYTVVPVRPPTFEWYEQVTTSDGKTGAVGDSIWTNTGAEYVAFVEETDGALNEGDRVYYPVSELTSTGQSYQWDWAEDVDDAAVMAGRRRSPQTPVTACSCQAGTSAAADTTVTLETVAASVDTVAASVAALTTTVDDIAARVAALETTDAVDDADTPDDGATASGTPRAPRFPIHTTAALAGTTTGTP